jgi:hypothetical protein
MIRLEISPNDLGPVIAVRFYTHTGWTSSPDVFIKDGMRVVLTLLVLIAFALLARFFFAKQGIKLLKTLFSVLALVLGVVCAYILFLSIIQGHSLF